MNEIPPRSSHLLQAVESLKKAGLSKIGDVVQTANPEFLDASSFVDNGGSGSSFFSEDSYIMATAAASLSTTTDKKNDSDETNGISIHVYQDSVSEISGFGGSTNKESTSGLDEFDVETVESVVTSSTTQSLSKPLSLSKPRNAPDPQFSIKESTDHCSKGKDLWSEGQHEAALLEFRKALLGLESILGMNHVLVSKLYQWIGQIFLRLLDDDENNRRNGKQQKDTAIRRKAWADAAVESLTWCLKIRYISRADSTGELNGPTDAARDDMSIDTVIEGSLSRAWKFQAEEWSSSHHQEPKTLEMIRDSIRIEHKTDLALFRMEKNKLSEAIDVYASLASQYNKSISVCSDDGGFSSMTKMAFWYHRLGRIKSPKTDSSDGITIPSKKSNFSIPLQKTDQSNDDSGKKKINRSRAYLEQAAFWYRMALETFCTGIGRFDKTNNQYRKDESIDITAHTTYQQLVLRLEQVLTDYKKSDESKKDDEISYLRSMAVFESVLHHFRANQAMRQYRRLGSSRSDSLSRLKALRDNLAKAQEGFRAAANIEESAWGADHQIVLQMHHDLDQANALCNSVDEEIRDFPARQAKLQQQQEEHQRGKQKEKALEKKKQQQKEKEKRQAKLKQQYRHQKRRPKSPSGSNVRSNRPSSSGIETLRRLQDQVHQSQKLLEGQNVERDRLRADLESKNREIEKARATVARKEEEAMEWKRNCENALGDKIALQSRIQELQTQVTLSKQNQKEGTELIESTALNEVELHYWKEKFETAQAEWTEHQLSLEEELQKAHADTRSNELKLIVEQLREENEMLQREVTSWSTERKQFEEQQVLDTMKRVAKSDSEALLWKHKFEVAQKDLIVINNKADEQTRMAITDANKTAAELARWKKKFEIAQKEWMAIQTKAEKQAMEAITTAEQYETSHSEIKEKFVVAQNRLRSLLDENEQLRKQVVDSRAKQDQLEYSFKKQAIDFANFQDALTQKTAEAQIWKDQWQASQQAQKQFSHEMQLSRATDSNLQERIVDLLQRNKELQAAQERKNLELEAKNKEVASVKEAALKRIRQLKKEQQQHTSRNKEYTKEGDINSVLTKPENQDVTNGENLTEYESNNDLIDPTNLAAKLGRTQRALEFVEKDHQESLKEIKSLTKAKEEMEGNIADAQHIISLLKTANSERIEQCSKLEAERDQIKRQLEVWLDESHQNKAQNEVIVDLNDNESQVRIRNLMARCEELEKELIISNKQIEDQVRESTKETNTSPRESMIGKQEDNDILVIERLETELRESIEVRESLALQLNECNKKIANADEKELEYQKKLDFSSQQIKTLRNQVHDNMRESNSIDGWQEGQRLSLVQDLERELEESIEIREKISVELKLCKEKILILEENDKESKRLSNNSRQLESELEETLRIRGELSSELNSLKQRLEEKEEELDFLEDKKSKIEQELEQSSNENNRLQHQIDNLTSTAGDDDGQRRKLVDRISTLENELADTVNEIKSLRAENSKLDKLSEEVATAEEEKEEIMEKYRNLEKQYRDTKGQAEQNSKSLATMLEVESKEQDRIRKECAKLEKDLQEMSKQNLELESRLEEIKMRQIENLSDHSRGTTCQQCIILGDELRSTIEQNEKHFEAAEKFQDDHEKLINRNNFLEIELKEAIEQNEILESKLLAKQNSTNDDSLDNDEKYQDLNIRCIVLEEELQNANELNDKKGAQIEALMKKVEDLEDFADSTVSDLERALANNAKGAGGDQVRLLIERCDRLQYQLKESQKENKGFSNVLNMSKEEADKSLNIHVNNSNNESAEAIAAHEQAIQELNDKLREVTTAKEELETLLQEATEETEQQKRLKGHVEKDRDYLDKMYNECKRDMAQVKSDLETTKELLRKSDADKEELERQLQIEKHVSHSLKTSKTNREDDHSEENELEDLYRQARDELSEVENMLFETEEELDSLKAKYQELQESSKLSASERAESELSGDIVHDLHDLTREELMKETKKSLRKLQETQTKVVDLQETNMILQAQLKSSLTFKEKSKAPRRRSNRNGGFWGLGGGDGGKKPKDEEGRKEDNDNKDASAKGNDEANESESNDNPNNGNKRFWGWGGGPKGGNEENETRGDENNRN